MREPNRRTEDDEATQRILDPHRAEEQRLARQEAASRLSARGIDVRSEDSDDDVADLMDTIERFELHVERLGGDLMVNRIGSSEPEDPDFVPPVRQPDEQMPGYLRRMEERIMRLQGR